MHPRHRFRRLTAALSLAALGLGAVALPALAAEAEPSLIAQAWYWEPQQNQSVDTPQGSVSIEAPNPFCPQAPGALGGTPETCAEGRLPVEVVNGDYETPDKVSALTFDLTMVPIGSKVSKFTVTMLEAEAGCYEKEGAATGQQCEETDPRNADDKEIAACEVTEIFGEGDARPYKEIPKFTCTDADPVAKRKQIPNNDKTDPNDTDEDHVWTFDLTPFAQRWAETPPLCTCILLHPKEPKEVPSDESRVDWRVVFAGPKFPEGIVATIEFTPPPGGGALPPPPAVPPTTTGTTGSTGSTGTTVGTFGGGDLGGGSSDAGTPAGDTGGAATDAPTEAPGTTPTAADVPEVEAMPGYVWLAILAGILCWSMVRSLLFDRVTGHRPNGVLAQIHRINAGSGAATAAVASTPGPLDAVRNLVSRIGNGAGSLVSKLRRKG